MDVLSWLLFHRGFDMGYRTTIPRPELFLQTSDTLGSEELTIYKASPSLSEFFKSTTARMRHFQSNRLVSLVLGLRQWYGLL